MSGSFARDKGQRGEREVCKLLQPVVNETFCDVGLEPPVLERNLVQTRSGGFDISGLDWIALEVKRHETTQISQWWVQCKQQAGDTRIPVLLWRRNNEKWKCRMFGYLDGGSSGRVRCPVDIGLDAFLIWFKFQLVHRLKP